MLELGDLWSFWLVMTLGGSNACPSFGWSWQILADVVRTLFVRCRFKRNKSLTSVPKRYPGKIINRSTILSTLYRSVQSKKDDRQQLYQNSVGIDSGEGSVPGSPKVSQSYVLERSLAVLGLFWVPLLGELDSEQVPKSCFGESC